MKGLILSGGKGTRLRPITHTSAKQLVPVANKPILFYGIEHMAEVGITEIGIIIGETGDDVRAAIGDGSRWGVQVTYLPQDEPLGLAHCVLIARDFLGDDDFVMYLGDNRLEQGLAGIVERFHAARAAAGTPALDQHPDAPSARILLCPVPDPQRFGVAELDGDRVVRLVEKPVDPPSDLAMVGVYLFTAAIHEGVANIVPSERGELEIVDAVQWLIDDGQAVHHDVLEGWWLDTGKKDSLLEADRRALEAIEPRNDGKVDDGSDIDGRVVIEAGATLVGSTVRGPAIIGDGATIGDGAIIGDGATITASDSIDGVFLVAPAVHGDDRGFFVETYRRSWFPFSREMIQGNRAARNAGAIVGLHYHLHQSDYWYVIDGHARVVLHDLRSGSATEGHTQEFDLGEVGGAVHNHLGVYIPPGVAHGFSSITDVTLTYLVDGYYNPADELGVAWDDPAIGADWGLAEPILSDRDAANPLRSEIAPQWQPHAGLRS